MPLPPFLNHHQRHPQKSKMMHPRNHLPAEIYHIIFDNLRKESYHSWLRCGGSHSSLFEYSTQLAFPAANEPLYECALVCREWLEHARKTFWTFYPFPLATSWGNKLSMRHCARLMENLVQPGCTFIHHIRALLIQGSRRAGRKGTFDLLDQVLEQLLDIPIKPKVLLISDLSFDSLTARSRAILKSFVHVEELALINNKATFRSYFTLAASFPMLQSFTLGTSSPIHLIPVAEIPPSINNLRHLSMPSAFYEFMAPYLNHSQSTPSIEDLSTYIDLTPSDGVYTRSSDLPQPVASANQLLKYAGSALKKLTLKSSPKLLSILAKEQEAPDWQSPLTFVHNTSLSHLQLLPIGLTNSKKYRTDYILTLLGTIGSPYIHTLEFHIILVSNRDWLACFDNFDWQALDKFLTQHFETVARFQFLCHHNECDSDSDSESEPGSPLDFLPSARRYLGEEDDEGYFDSTLEVLRRLPLTKRSGKLEAVTTWGNNCCRH